MGRRRLASERTLEVQELHGAFADHRFHASSDARPAHALCTRCANCEDLPHLSNLSKAFQTRRGAGVCDPIQSLHGSSLVSNIYEYNAAPVLCNFVK